MSLKSFKFALVACLAATTAASAATVTMTRTADVVRTQVQGGGTYDVYDLFWTSADGAQFTNYTLTAITTTGNLADPARLQDDRQTANDPGTQDGNTAGAVDLYANTVMSAAAKVDGGYAASITADPAFYVPAGSGAAPLFSQLKWDVFDTEGDDDNDLSNHPAGPFNATAPFHIARILATPDSVGTINILAFDTANPGIATPFDFLIQGDQVLNTPPTVNPEPADLDPPAETGAATPGPGQTNVVTTTFTATDAETPGGPFTFSNAVLSSFVPLFPGAVNPAFNGTVAADGTFTWNTTGFARGTYTINVTATDGGPGTPLASASGGGFVVTIDAVPEPTTLALCGLALVGSLGLIRRRNG